MTPATLDSLIIVLGSLFLFGVAGTFIALSILERKLDRILAALKRLEPKPNWRGADGEIDPE